MKKFAPLLMLASLLVTATLITSAKDTNTVTLDLQNGDIVITPTNYKQGNEDEVDFIGKYEITGERSSDTPLQIKNETGDEATFDITLDNAKIIGSNDCTAFRIDGNSPVHLNLAIVGECIIEADNHAAIKSGNTSMVTVDITTDIHANLTFNRRTIDGTRHIIYETEHANSELLSLKIDGETPDNMTSYSHQHVFNPEDYTSDGTATCKSDGTKSARCSASDSCWKYDTITDEGSKKHNFESGICPTCGLHGTELSREKITWLKYDNNGTTTWFGIDNEKAVFEDGSYFWVEYINTDNSKTYWNSLDDTHKNKIEDDNYILFEIGVAKSNFEEYTTLPKSVPVYIQIQDDWDANDLKATFIQSGVDEDISVEFTGNYGYPDGKDNFAKITLNHFSPYVVYDELTKAEQSSSPQPPAPNTGDTSSTFMMILLAVSCAFIVYTKKHYFRRTHS